MRTINVAGCAIGSEQESIADAWEPLRLRFRRRNYVEAGSGTDAYPSVDASRALVDADSLDLPAALN